MTRLIALFIVALFCLTYAFAEAAVFRIGKPDARAAEFKAFRGLDDMRFEYMTGYPETFRAYRNLDSDTLDYINTLWETLKIN